MARQRDRARAREDAKFVVYIFFIIFYLFATSFQNFPSLHIDDDDDEKLISITHKRCLLQNALLFSSLFAR